MLGTVLSANKLSLGLKSYLIDLVAPCFLHQALTGCHFWNNDKSSGIVKKNFPKIHKNKKNCYPY